MDSETFEKNLEKLFNSTSTTSHQIQYIDSIRGNAIIHQSTENRTSCDNAPETIVSVVKIRCKNCGNYHNAENIARITYFGRAVCRECSAKEIPVVKKIAKIGNIILSTLFIDFFCE